MSEMITEQQLKNDCNPNMIKRMVELAEGFELIDDETFNFVKFEFYLSEIFDDTLLFSTLIHRAVEEWDRTNKPCHIEVNYYNRIIYYYIPSSPSRPFQFKNYQPQLLTQLELALLHCLIEVLKEE